MENTQSYISCKILSNPQAASRQMSSIG